MFTDEDNMPNDLVRTPRASFLETTLAKKPIRTALLFLVMLGLVTLGPVNYVLLKVLYSSYKPQHSYFISQGINLLYILYGGVVLYPRMMFTNSITPEMRAFPKYKLLTMGILDSCGTFLAAMGAFYTPGQYMLLLNQILIPMTMLASRIFIGSRYTKMEFFGALFIVSGAVVTVLGSGKLETDDQKERWYAILIYFLSNVPMACSSVYKESQFNEAKLDVWYLTQWVSIFQLIAGFVFAPALMIPGVGSETGLPWHDILSNFWEGCRCFAQIEISCKQNNTFLLLLGYCFVNILFNTLGLYLVKKGSAVLNGLSFALVLPFSTLAFTLPFLNQYKESTHYTTWIGLLLVLFGFGIYQYFSQSVGVVLNDSPHEDIGINSISTNLISNSIPTSRSGKKRSSSNISSTQSSFQERVVGMGYVHRPPQRRISDQSSFFSTYHV